MYDNNSFPMLFSAPNYHQPLDEGDEYSSYSSSSSSPDCTLSLGTPSTRVSEKKRSGFCNWNIMKPKQTNSPATGNKNARGSCAGGREDSLLARRCANCDTTSTPLWRNGPRGPKSLCNACGIRFKKEERRASNAAASTTAYSTGAPVDHQYIRNNSWSYQHSPTYAYYPRANGNEFSFIDATHHGDADANIPNPSWGFNVADRPSYVHY